MARQYDNTAPNYVPSTTYPDAGAFIQRDARPTVVMASNAASDWRVVVLAGMFLVLLTTVVWIVAHYGFHLHRGWSAIFALLVFAACGRFALLIVNGDWVAHREIGANERVEHKRLNEAAGVAHRHYDVEEAKEEHRHAEEMARIEAQTINREMRDRMALTEDTIHAMQRKLLAEDSVVPVPPTFVQAHTAPAEEAVHAWIDSLWHSDGTPTFKNGNTPMPWTGLWRGEPWCNEAREIVLQSGIVVPNASGKYFPVIPKSKREARFLMKAHLGR